MRQSKRAKEHAAWYRRQRFHRLKNHPFVVPVATFIGLFFMALAGYVVLNSHPVVASDSHLVILSHDNKRQTIPTRAKTVGDLLKAAQLTLHDGDVVEPTPDTLVQEDNFRVNIYRAKPVTIFDGDKQTHTLNAATTPRSVVTQAGIKLDPEDLVTIEAAGSILKEGVLGQKLVIRRAIPVSLNIYGIVVAVRTQATTVGGLLKEKNIKLAEGDTVQPAEDSPITPGKQIFILRKGTLVQTAEEIEPAPLQVVDDRSLSYGTLVIRQQGVAGKKLVTFIVDANGQRQVIQEVIIQSPVAQIVARGTFINISSDRTSLMAAAGISPGDYAAVNYIVSRESNWHPDARNAGGCLGLGQRCPGSALINACPNWDVDPICQLRYFTSYADARFGGWGGAYAYWQSHGYW
ncbi:DUF348 domain-containing protein [Candidatus Saccharibacteria bacterium]|nr:DUF348 domain-containing protein [Candidatus Saccharibacteria bacterium]